MKRTKSVLIIGAGIGGISAAIHLALRGMHVTLIEKNANAGGRCDWIERDGHHFDTGPTLMVMKHVYDDEFTAIGASIDELLDLRQVDPTYHLVFDDGSQLALSSDRDFMRDQLEAIEPGAYDGFLCYHAEGERHYRLAMDRLVNRNFRKASDFYNLANISLVYQLRPLVNHYANVCTYFKNPRLRAAFTFQDVYMGLSPFDGPATFSLMPYTELEHGVWYPKGGMYSIVEALVSLAKQAGVEFRFDTTAEKILVEDGSVRGAMLEQDEKFIADVVLANADLPYVYQSLLPEDGLFEKLSRKQYSCSTISYFWGMDKPVEGLGPHTLFLADDYGENFVSIIQKLGLPDNPSLYIHHPTQLDPSMAPQGEDTLIAIVPVGHLSGNGEQDWDALTDQARLHVFRRLAMIGIKDLEKHIKFETTFTPLSWRKRYNLVKGSTHGLSHNLTQLGYFRPANRHPKYRNMFFVGASTHPGTGIPTAMISGRLVSERILDEQAED